MTPAPAEPTPLRFAVLLALLAGALALLCLLALSVGAVWVSPAEIVHILLGGKAEETTHAVLLLFRLPRVMTAVLAGAALALCGLQMQTLFQNPLAGPDVLGISAGASLGVAIVVLIGGSIGATLGAWGLTGAAVAGAAASMALVLAVSVRLRDNLTLLIAGLLVAGLVTAIVSVLQYFATADQMQSFVLWTFGSLGGVTWHRLGIIAPCVAVGVAASLVLAKPLNLLLLGEGYARSMGLNVRRTRYAVIGLVSLLTGCITAFCGPIAFVGIMVPHLARMALPTTNHFKLLPAVALVGAITLVVCDMVAQLPGLSMSLPINAVTSLVGAPVVIWVILTRHEAGRSLGRGRFG
jgi:iron complex transport system permease protein